MPAPDFVRTPEERFANLPDYPWEPNWLDWDGLRLHYLDEGDGPPVMLFHGEPTWSFLYRKVMRELLAAGHRVVAPDYFGFGRSDKPVDPAYYTYDRHVGAMGAVVEHLDLEDACAVVQDWGGAIGLKVAVDHPERFRRLSILNTALFRSGMKISDGFRMWRQFVEQTDDLPIGFIMQRAAHTEWPEEVFAAYEAPFPDVTYKVGARQFPLIVPLQPGDPGAAAMEAVTQRLSAWEGPTQVMFSTQDPIFSTRVGERFVDAIPGAEELEVIEEAGHFLQEDQGHQVGERLAAFLARTG